MAGETCRFAAAPSRAPPTISEMTFGNHSNPSSVLLGARVMPDAFQAYPFVPTVIVTFVVDEVTGAILLQDLGGPPLLAPFDQEVALGGTALDQWGEVELRFGDGHRIRNGRRFDHGKGQGHSSCAGPGVFF